MIVFPRSAAVIVAVILVFSITTLYVTTRNVLASDDRNTPHIVFSFPGNSLENIATDTKSDREGWTETAKWRSKQGEPYAYINIFAHVSYRKVLMNSHVRPPGKRVGDIAGSYNVVLGATDRVSFKNGFYEYQLYSLNGVQCAYIQSYWGDKSFGGIDIVRGADAADTIVGNHMLQANSCDQNKQEMSSKNVTEILSSIDLRDAYWSKSWFDAEIKSAVPGVTGTETNTDNQAAVETRLEKYSEGISGTYRSYITSNKGYMFQNPKHRKMIITLIQHDKTITGTDQLVDSEITGTLEGDTIKFNFWSGKIASEVDGEWKISEDGRNMQGFWRFARSGGYGGIWNLTRIE